MRLLFGFTLLFTIAGLTPAAEPPAATLLFAGSSSTYWNDMPDAIAQAVTGKVKGYPERKIIAQVVGRSGSDIRVYREEGFDQYEYGVAKGQTFLQKIATEKPAMVVLQAVCGFAMADEPKANGAAHLEALQAYCEAIKKAGGEPIIYEMGWGKTAKEEQGRARLKALADANQVKRYVPCSAAWARVYRDKPDLKLQHPQDGAHPGDLGHFLNVACFYAVLTGGSPLGKLPRTYPVWAHAVGKNEVQVPKNLDELIAQFQPTAYQATLPKWMRKNMVIGGKATIDDATARYLETVAWETTQAQASKP
jgi:hypothetical protein